MKKVIITIVSIALVVLIMYSFMKHAKETPVEQFKINEIEVDINSETIQKLYKIVNQKDDLRKASLDNESIDDETIIKYILVNMEPTDYKDLNVQNVKVICEPAKGVIFHSDHPCKVRFIPNQNMDNIKKRLFNIDRKVEYKDIQYRGLDCRNNGSSYFCNINGYNDTTASFSVLNKATKYNNEIYLYEYYLKVNLNSQEDCNKYFSKDYCSNYKGKEVPVIVDDVIINKGVYYRHVFRLGNDGKYYLKSSNIFVE